MSLNKVAERAKANREREADIKKSKAEGRWVNPKVSDSLEVSENILRNFILKKYETKDLTKCRGQLLRNLVCRSNLKIIGKLTEFAKDFKTLGDINTYNNCVQLITQLMPKSPNLLEVINELVIEPDDVVDLSKPNKITYKFVDYLIRYSYLVSIIFGEYWIKYELADRILHGLAKYPDRMNVIVTVQNIVSIYRFYERFARQIPAIRGNITLNDDGTKRFISDAPDKNPTGPYGCYSWVHDPPFIYFKIPAIYDLNILPRSLQYRLYYIAKNGRNLPLPIDEITAAETAGFEELHLQYSEKSVNYEFPIPIGPELLIFGIDSFKRRFKRSLKKSKSKLDSKLDMQNYAAIGTRPIYEPEVFRLVCAFAYGPDYKKSRVPIDIYYRS